MASASSATFASSVELISLLNKHFNLITICAQLALKLYLQENVINDKDNRGPHHLKEFFNRERVVEWVNDKKTRLFPSQITICSNPDPNLEQMDVSLLTKIVIHFYGSVKKATDAVKKLMDFRNKIAHVGPANMELAYLNQAFNDARKEIEVLAELLQPHHKQEVHEKIKHIEGLETVRTLANLDKKMIKGEYYMTKLVAFETEGETAPDNADFIRIMFNLFKWLGHLSKMRKVNQFLRCLKEEKVISFDQHKTISDEYNDGKKVELLVLCLEEKGDYKCVLKFCQELRRFESKLADCVENDASDGKDTEKMIIEKTKDFILKYLPEKLIHAAGQSIPCETLQIQIEEQNGDPVNFVTVEQCFQQVFPASNYESGDTSFTEVFWKDHPPVEFSTPENVNVPTIQCVQKLCPFECMSNYTYVDGATIKSLRKTDLLHPIHEFRNSKKPSKHWIAKEVLQFLAACMNSYQNGTIHFGIEQMENGDGRITGLCKFDASHIENEIQTSLKICFNKNHLRSVQSCLRCIREISVGNSTRIVYEFDVIASYLQCPMLLTSIQYPPKGRQRVVCFKYINNMSKCEIVEIDEIDIQNRKEQTDREEVNEEKLKETKYLERKKMEEHNLQDTSGLKDKLISMLLGRSKMFVTDEYVPIIVIGNFNPDVNDYFQQIFIKSISTLFSRCVLDFTTQENEDRNMCVFDVKTADCISKQTEPFGENGHHWIICDNSGQDHVLCCLEKIRNSVPLEKVRVFFFANGRLTVNEPFFQVAKKMMTEHFRGKCYMIAESKDDCTDFAKLENVEGIIHTGLQWKKVLYCLKSVFPPLSDAVVYRLPSDQDFIDVTQEDINNMNLTDISIVSSDEYAIKAFRMTADEKERHSNDYRNSMSVEDMTLWRFFYGHVIKRQLCENTGMINEKFKNMSLFSEHFIETHNILHHPGAGGSTLGLHILWQFCSFGNKRQYKDMQPKAYRCCLVKDFTSTTVAQIECLQKFKQTNVSRPVLILTDDMAEISVECLMSGLKALTCPIKCVVVIIKRINMTTSPEQNCTFITHNLTEKEKNKFNALIERTKPNKELQGKINNMLEYCVMQDDIKRDVVFEIMNNIEAWEMYVLQCLAFVTFYTSKGLPTSALVRHSSQLPTSKKFSLAFNVLCKTEKSEIVIISKELANVILEDIIRRRGCSVMVVIDELLNVMKKCSSSKEPDDQTLFVTICKMFTHNQNENENVASDLVDYIDKELGIQDIERILTECLNISNDVCIGKQLVLWYIRHGNFPIAFKISMELIEKHDRNISVYETYYQWYKEKLKCVISEKKKPQDRQTKVIVLKLFTKYKKENVLSSVRNVGKLGKKYEFDILSIKLDAGLAMCEFLFTDHEYLIVELTRQINIGRYLKKSLNSLRKLDPSSSEEFEKRWIRLF